MEIAQTRTGTALKAELRLEGNGEGRTLHEVVAAVPNGTIATIAPGVELAIVCHRQQMIAAGGDVGPTGGAGGHGDDNRRILVGGGTGAEQTLVVETPRIKRSVVPDRNGEILPAGQLVPAADPCGKSDPAGTRDDRGIGCPTQLAEIVGPPRVEVLIAPDGQRVKPARRHAQPVGHPGGERHGGGIGDRVAAIRVAQPALAGIIISPQVKVSIGGKRQVVGAAGGDALRRGRQRHGHRRAHGGLIAGQKKSPAIELAVVADGQGGIAGGDGSPGPHAARKHDLLQRPGGAAIPDPKLLKGIAAAGIQDARLVERQQAGIAACHLGPAGHGRGKRNRHGQGAAGEVGVEAIAALAIVIFAPGKQHPIIIEQVAALRVALGAELSGRRAPGAGHHQQNKFPRLHGANSGVRLSATGRQNNGDLLWEGIAL